MWWFRVSLVGAKKKTNKQNWNEICSPFVMKISPCYNKISSFLWRYTSVHLAWCPRLSWRNIAVQVGVILPTSSRISQFIFCAVVLHVLTTGNTYNLYLFCTGESCQSHEGESVPSGELFRPYDDPCVECLCENGQGRPWTIFLLHSNVPANDAWVGYTELTGWLAGWVAGWSMSKSLWNKLLTVLTNCNGSVFTWSTSNVYVSDKFVRSIHGVGMCHTCVKLPMWGFIIFTISKPPF